MSAMTNGDGPRQGEGVRIEHDTMGEVAVPASTPCGGRRPSARSRTSRSAASAVDPALIRALARIKAAAARVNAELGRPRPGQSPTRSWPRRRRSPTGGHDDQFPVDVFQTGSGTSHQHERQRGDRLARRPAARRRVPPQRRRERQSSRATTRSRRAVHIAAAAAVLGDLLPALAHLARRPGREGRESTRTSVKSGRTHLMDATPGDARAGARRVRRAGRLGVERLAAALPRVARAAARRDRRRHRHQHARRVSPRGDPAALEPTPTGLPFTEAGTTSRRRAPRTRWSSCRGALRTCAVEPDRRSATTCAGWAPARPPGSARSTSRTSSPARDHARQGQPGRSRRPSSRSARRSIGQRRDRGHVRRREREASS